MLVPATGEQPEAVLLNRERLGYLHDAIAELPEQLRIVVQGYFFDQRKMLDIAAELGVTESRVSQLRGEALTMLGAGMKAADATLVARSRAVHRSKPHTRAREATSAAHYAAVAYPATVSSYPEPGTALAEPTALSATDSRS